MAPSTLEAGPASSFTKEPPPLPLSLRDHKKQIAFEWTIIVVDSCILPVIMFYALWFGTNLPPATTFAIITGAFGLVSVVEFLIQLQRLIRKDDFMRPLGAGRGSLDMFQIFFSIGTIAVTLQLVLGTIPDDPLIRLLSMPTPTVMFMVGGLLLFIDTCHVLGLHMPVRISSLPPGALARPGVYTIIEDVVAVDGRAGKPYREALDARYEASPLFRRMLLRVSFFWSIGALVTAGALTAIIYTVPDVIAFGIGWGVPFVWAAIWTLITIRYVQASLAEEKKEWCSDVKSTIS